MTFYPFVLVRTFTTPSPNGGTLEQRLSKVLELPLPPARGVDVMLPGETAPRHVVRVTLFARLAGVTWTPGFKIIEAVHAELEPEPAEHLAGAFADGWRSLAEKPRTERMTA